MAQFFFTTADDNITLGGSDKATLVTGHIFTPATTFNPNDTVAGAGINGSSTIEFRSGVPFTFDLADYTNITGITQLTFVDARNYQVTVNEAFVVNNHNTLNALTFKATSTGSITVNASTVTTGSVNVTGSSANDLVTGGAGNDIISGGSGADTLSGGAGDDQIFGNAGNDVLDGGAGNDIVSFASAASGVTVNMGAGTASDGDGGTDAISNFEIVVGSAFADQITGGTGADTISGGSGNDTISGADGGDFLVGNAGNDVLNGGNGTDTISFASATAGVTVNMGTGTASDGDGGTDTILNFEHLFGSGFADILRGGANNDTFSGGAGADSISGGAGFDYVDYQNAPAAINANLATGTVRDGHGSTDALVDIEGVIGSAGADTLKGSSGDDLFNARSGNDTIDGGGGNDFIIYEDATISAANINLSTGSATDGEGGTDTFTNIEGAVGSIFADTITGSGAALEFFDGRAGNDTIDGGGGVDWVGSLKATAAVNVNLTTGTATDGLGGTDTLTNIENVNGTEYNDTITGSAGVNFLVGAAGTDVISGGAGDDSILGDAGADTIDGGDGNDLLFGDADADLITGGAGNDTIVGGNATDVGNDTVSGGFGNDLIFGSPNNDQLQGDVGNDTIIGGAGNDTIIGDAGNDLLWGDAGADRFIFAAAAGADTIADFEAGTDTIDLTALHLPAKYYEGVVSFAEYENGLTINFIGGAVLTIVGVRGPLFTDFIV